MKQPCISVIVPTYNSSRTIVDTVNCLLQQTLPPLEIIVVDDGSTDNTKENLTLFAERILYLHQANSGPASARNHGLKAAKGELIAFTDSDCLPQREWLSNLAQDFTTAQIAGVGGIVRSAESSIIGQYVDAIRLLDPLPDESGEIPYLITANACFRQVVLLEAGMFNEDFRRPGGEEADLGQRIRALGYKFHCAEQAVVLHYHRQTVGSLLRTLANYGSGRHQLAQRYASYSISAPLRLFCRRLLALRSLFQRMPAYALRYGWRKAVFFSLLDYLTQAAFVFGYWRRGWRRA